VAPWVDLVGSWGQRLGAVAVGLALLGTVEGVLRLALGPPPPPVRVYKALGEHDVWLEPRGDGLWPAYQTDARRIPQATVVVVLGGSSVHGGTPGLQRGGEFAAVAGRQLGIPVANLGSPGLDSHDLVEVLTDLLAHREAVPDLETVVVYAGHNDFGNARFQHRYGTVSAGLAAHLQSALGHFQLYTQLSLAVRPVVGDVRRIGGVDDFEPLSPTAWQTTLRHLDQNLARMVHLTQRADLDLVLMAPMSDLSMPPVDSTCGPSRCPSRDYAAGMESLDLALLQRARDTDLLGLRSPTAVGEMMVAVAINSDDVEAICVEDRVPQDRVLPVPLPVLFHDPIHPSAVGHQALGELLADLLGPA